MSARLASALGLLICAACGAETAAPRAESRAAGEALPAAEVKLATASEVPWPRTLRAVGSLAPFERATLSAKVPGRVIALAIDLGSRVRRGDVVARVDPTDYELRVRQSEAALAQARARLGLPVEGDDDRVDPEKTAIVREAKAQLDGARSTWERWSGLKGTGAASEEGLDAARNASLAAEGRYQDAREEIENRRAQLVQRRADIAVARRALADTEIVAPFEGLALERLVGLGDYLAAGAAVATLVRVDPLRLRAEIPEREAALVRAGQAVRLSVEGDARVFPGVIARLRPEITERSRTLVVEADVPNAGWAGVEAGNGDSAPVSVLRPGAFAKVEIVVDPAATALAVPASALSSFAGVDKVFTVEGGKAVERRVVVGRKAEDRLEILSGLEKGDTVVLAPGGLQGGQMVRAVP